MSEHILKQQNETSPLFPLWLSIVLTVLLLIIAVPLFVCSPVTSDTSLFDVQAMTVLKGGILYRDIIEPNLPGVVWIHLALRTVIGWSSEAIRAADLGIFSVTLFLLANVVKVAGNRIQNSGQIGLLVLTCCLFYVTRNEWCHCQRDIWMLLPVSCALWLRATRIEDAFPNGISAPETDEEQRAKHSDIQWKPAYTLQSPFCSTVVEGAFWGIAFWIKPHVAIPAMAVIAIDTAGSSGLNARAKNIGGVIGGGLLAAVPGIIWLISTGAWEHFWTMMLEWNPEYLQAGRNRRSWNRVAFLLQRFHPWWIVHVIAVPTAVRTIIDSFQNRRTPEHFRPAVRCMLGTCYLFWLLQTFLLQHAMDYIHVPEFILAFCVIAAYPWQLDLQLRRVFVVSLLGLGLVSAPFFYAGRLGVWKQCLQGGSTPEVRGVLAQGNYPDWQHLAQVEQFLAAHNVRDGDVTCLNVHSIHLHQELGVLPATRYWSIICPLTMFPKRYDEIMASVNRGRQRFVVVETNETNQQDQILPGAFPNNYPVVFESGSYRIHDSSATTIGQFTAAP